MAAPAPQSFHLHTDQRQVIDQVFKAYGLKAMLDDSVRPNQVRLDLDNVNFEEAAYILGLATHTFYVPLDAHHALVADDTRDKREQFTPQEMETVYLAGLSADEMNEVQSLAKNVFAIQQAQLSTSENSLTLRAPASTLDAFNSTMRSLLDGRSQVLLDVQMIQVAHTGERNTGVVAAAELRRIQCVRRGAVAAQPEREPGAADHFVGAGFAQRSAGHPGHSHRLRPGFEPAAFERLRPVRRRPDGIGARARHDDLQPEPEYVRFARTRPDSAAPGGRTG